MKDKDNFMIEAEEMMPCCLTTERHIGRPQDSLLTESATAELEAGESEYSENYNVHSLRNGHVEALARLSTS